MGERNDQGRREFFTKAAALSLAPVALTATEAADAQTGNPRKFPRAEEFDIRGKGPGSEWRRKRVADAEQPRQDNFRRYRRVNTMAYLLSETTYNELYSKDATPVYYLLKNRFVPLLSKPDLDVVKFFEGDTQRRADVIAKFEELIAYLEGHKTITFRDVYLNRNQNPEDEIRRLLQEASALNMYEFCLPFVQYGSDECVIDDFLTHYGCFSLYELLVLSKENSVSCAGVPWDSVVTICINPGKEGGKKVALDALAHPFLFVDPAKPIAEEKVTASYLEKLLGDSKCNDPNGNACAFDKRSCVYTGGTCFCTMAEDGYCSIVSCCQS